jgi:hypothetical protein
MQPLPGSIRKTPFSYSLVIIRNNLGGCQRFAKDLVIVFCGKNIYSQE